MTTSPEKKGKKSAKPESEVAQQPEAIETKGEYRCSDCGRTFETSHALLVHRSIQINKGDPEHTKGSVFSAEPNYQLRFCPCCGVNLSKFKA